VTLGTTLLVAALLAPPEGGRVVVSVRVEEGTQGGASVIVRLAEDSVPATVRTSVRVIPGFSFANVSGATRLPCWTSILWTTDTQPARASGRRSVARKRMAWAVGYCGAL